MDCRTARQLLDFARPRCGELDATEASDLESHLADCPDCGTLARSERQWDEHLGRAVQAVPVPDGLRNRLLARLDAQRRARQRRPLLKSAAVAAALLLAFGVWSWWSGRLAHVDLQRVHWEENEKIASPPEKMEAWLQAKAGRKLSAPNGFNYAFLRAYEMADFQGKQVPQLWFIRGDAHARVYILTADQFDLKALAAQPPAQSGGYAVEVRLHPTNQHVAFVVIYTGDSLGPFLTDKQPAIDA